jgi:hypothetical protein
VFVSCFDSIERGLSEESSTCQSISFGPLIFDFLHNLSIFVVMPMNHHHTQFFSESTIGVADIIPSEYATNHGPTPSHPSRATQQKEVVPPSRPRVADHHYRVRARRLQVVHGGFYVRMNDYFPRSECQDVLEIDGVHAIPVYKDESLSNTTRDGNVTLPGPQLSCHGQNTARSDKNENVGSVRMRVEWQRKTRHSSPFPAWERSLTPHVLTA